MKRKEFIEKLGLGAAFVLTSTCLGSCSKDGTHRPTDPVDFTLSLNDPAISNLTLDGGYILHEGVVVARDMNGNYVAATVICSHEGLREIVFRDNEWFCTAHDARFELDGEGLNSNGSGGLTVYNTELVGTDLRVYS